MLADHRDRARQAGAVSRQADHPCPRRRRQGDPDADRGTAGAGVPAGQGDGVDAGVAGRRGNRRARRHSPGDDLRQLRGQAAALPRRLDRRAGCQRDRQRSGDGGRAPAGADRLDDPRGGARRPTCCAPRSRRSPVRPALPRSRSSAATRRSWSAALPTACICARPAWASSIRGPSCPPAASALATRSWSPGPIGEHGTAIMLARDQFDLDAEVESDTRCLWPAVDAMLEAVGARTALPARRHPWRRGLGAQRAGPGLAR